MTGKHRVLVIGAGSIGERHIRCFGNTGRAELSLCEIRGELAGQVGKRYSIEQVYGDFETAASSRPDAAVICTPAPYHVSMAARLAELGVHLLIEKPLSTSLAGVEELRGSISRGEIIAGVAYVLRSHPAIQAAHSALAEGRFGRPLQVVAQNGQHFPFYRPAYRETYYTQRKTGGGAIQDALTHLFNAVEWLVGPIAELAADAEHMALEGVEVEDTVHVMARHAGREGKVLGCYALNQHQAPNECTITVACERGTLRIELHKHRWLSQIKPDGEWSVEEVYSLERDDLFIAQASQYLDAVEQTQHPACSFADGVQTLRANLAALASVASRRWEKTAEVA